MNRRLTVLTIAACMLAGPAGASDTDSIEQGRAIAEQHCARCHAVGEDDASPHESAPPFRLLHERWPVEHLAESLAEGLVTGHPDMPEFVFETGEIDDFLAYLQSLEIADEDDTGLSE